MTLFNFYMIAYRLDEALIWFTNLNQSELLISLLGLLVFIYLIVINHTLTKDQIMIDHVTEADFITRFKESGRPDNFSREGLKALFEYLESYEEDCDTQIELDVIAICCEYTEDTIESVLENYELKDIDDLRDHTQVIEVDSDTIIYQNY